MLSNAGFEIVSVADVQAASVAMKHVGPESHLLAIAEEGQAFDKLRPNGWG